MGGSVDGWGMGEVDVVCLLGVEDVGRASDVRAILSLLSMALDAVWVSPGLKIRRLPVNSTPSKTFFPLRSAYISFSRAAIFLAASNCNDVRSAEIGESVGEAVEIPYIIEVVAVDEVEAGVGF